MNQSVKKIIGVCILNILVSQRWTIGTPNLKHCKLYNKLQMLLLRIKKLDIETLVR